MKKALLILSLCVLTHPLQSFADTTGVVKKAKHKKHHHVVKLKADKASPVMKDTAPLVAENDKSWIDNLSGYLTLASNYMFRGNSQTRNLPAIQGSLNYAFPYGIYANVWGSNVRFVDSTATVEMDTVIGVHNTIGENFTYDVSGARYNYPGARLLNYNELNTVFNYSFLQAGYSYSGNVYNTHTSGSYYNAGVKYDIPSNYAFGLTDLNILALMGHYTLREAAGFSYNDYNIMLTKKIKIYSFAVQWTNTNGRGKNSPYDGSTFIGQVTANF